jgi:hypothetical protein
MLRRPGASACCFLMLFTLTACGPSSKEDMLAKAREVKTRTQLESALGKPDDVSKLGPVEKWTYKAKNGQVVFVLVGDTVTIEAAGGGEKKD